MTQQRSRMVAFAAGVGAPFAAALAMVPLRHTIDNANVALVLAAVVVAVAMTGHRIAALAASISAMVWFDFFHTRPYNTFSIDRRDDVVTAVVLLLVGVLVSELAFRGRRHWLTAAERRDEITRIHAAAELVADGEPVELIVISVATELRDLLGVRDCRFDRGDHFDDVKPIARLERTGDVTFGQFRWGTDKVGFPGQEVELLVQGQARTFGRYVVTPVPGQPVSLEKRIVAVALADQVGAAFAARPTRPAGSPWQT